jgi:hypothetical protein
MKRVIFALGSLLLFACSKSNDSTSSSNPIPTPTISPYSLTNTTISGFTIPNISASQIQTAINGAVAGTIIYLKDNVEHMVIPGTLFFNYPLIPVIHLIKVGSTWQYENSYSEAAMGAGRNYECIDSTNQTWVYADTGLELSSGTWPFGNILVMKTSGNKLSWNTISNIKSFYHSVSSGDLNNDGLKDIIGLNMGQYGNWGDALHPYMQNSDGSFSENRNLFSSNYTSWAVNKGSGAVLIKNLLGNKYPDIIRADYGFNSSYQKPTDRYSFIILSYDSLQKKYDISRNPGPIGVFSNPDRGATLYHSPISRPKG